MTQRFKLGDHARWNSGADHVSGTVVEIHTRDFRCMGRTRRASAEDPQYEVKGDQTDRLAAHKDAALARA